MRPCATHLLPLPLLALSLVGCAWGRSVPPPSAAVPPRYVTDLPAEPSTDLASAAATAPAPSASSPLGADVTSPAPETVAARSALSQASSASPLWWTAFADSALDAAVDEALHNNYFLRDVRALIRENELNPATPKGALWPLQIGAPAQLQHATTAYPASPGQPGYTLTENELDVGLVASYQVDVWGQLEAQRKTSRDLVEQQRQSTETFAQTLAEQVTQTWFEILEQRALRTLLGAQVRYGRDLLAIVKARFEQHLVTRLTVLQQEQQLLDTESQVPLVVAQLALLSSRLTALLGRAPAPNVDLVPGDRRLPSLPPRPPIGAPSDLAQNSPEMRFARARVVEVEHLENENDANWLPRIDLVGAVGAQSFDFTDTYVTSSFGVRLTWPIFDGGQRITRAKQLAVTVQRRSWQYEAAYKTAVQRVQDAAIQEQKQSDHVQTLQAEVELGQHVLAEARDLFERGASDYLPVITALANVSRLERAYVQSQRLLLSYRAQLYHALGGTWSAAATQFTPTEGTSHSHG